VDLVKLILSRAEGLINAPDNDGWTPLLWACRPCGRWGTPSTPEAAVIKLLITHGADLWARGQGYDQDWSPLKLARYHGASTKVLRLLVPEKQRRVNEKGEGDIWDPEFHKSRRAQVEDLFCAACFFVSILHLKHDFPLLTWSKGIYGTYYRCINCEGKFGLCFKCARHKDEYHSCGKGWKVCAVEYAETADGESMSEDDGQGEGKAEQIQEDDNQESDWSD
jgi:hypothetical protein